MRHRSLARTGILNLVAQILLLGAFYALAHEHPLAVSSAWRTLIVSGLILGQSALWAAFFYLQDRAEPEPARFVFLAFLAGMAAAAIVVLPADQTLFRSAAWMYRSTTSLIVGAACVKGALAAALTYGIVRYGFATDREFDEPADGLAYGAFIGCGMAAAMSLNDFPNHPDFTLFAIATSAAINVLVYGSVGGLVGYLTGRTKFTVHPSGVVYAEAILLGAVLIGAYHIVAEYAIVSNSSQPLWAGAWAAAAFAFIVLGAATALMYRVSGTAAGVAGTTWPSGVLAVLTTAALLAMGAYAAYTGTRRVTFEDARYSISFAYDPIAAVSAGSGDAAVTQASFKTHGSPGLPMVFSARTANGATIAVQAEPGAVALDRANTSRYLRSDEPVDLTTTAVTIGGQRGVRLRYAYLSPSSAAGRRDLPNLHWAYTDLITAGGRTYAISFDAPPDAFGRDEPVYAALLSTVRWSAQ